MPGRCCRPRPSVSAPWRHNGSWLKRAASRRRGTSSVMTPETPC
jgi:hypothetical protein